MPISSASLSYSAKSIICVVSEKSFFAVPQFTSAKTIKGVTAIFGQNLPLICASAKTSSVLNYVFLYILMVVWLIYILNELVEPDLC